MNFNKFTLFILILSFFPVSEIFGQISIDWNNIPSEIKERNSFKRMEYFYRQRANPDGTFPIETYYQERKKEISGQANRFYKSLLELAVWTSVGPKGINATFPAHWGEMSGRVPGIAVDPSDANTVYIGAAAGGIWKSTNGGTSWTNLGDDLASLTFGALAVDPNNSSNVYAGAGEAMYSFNPNIYDGKGLYKSTDGGGTWTQITNGFGSQTQFSDIEVSPHNSNILFAALGSGYWHLGSLSNEGVWKSTDEGVTWTKVLSSADAFDVIVDPSDPNYVYAATGGVRAEAGFYYSSDGGNVWNQVNTGLPAGTSIGRMQIAQSPNNTLVFYALIYGSSTTVYKSTDRGINWNQISIGTNLGGTYNGSTWSDQGWYDLCIAADPSDENHVLLGNVELHQTTNGADFSPLRISGGTGAWDSPAHVDYHKIVFAPSNSDVIYVGCDGGIYKSTDGGSNWSSANADLSTLQLYRIASHPTNPDILFGGAQDNGNFRTLDRGATTYDFVSTGDGMECVYDYTDGNIVYFMTQYGSLYKSTNGGNSYTSLISSGGSWLVPVLLHPVNHNHIFSIYSGKSVMYSPDGGSQWYYLPGSQNVVSSDNINTMAMSIVDTSNIVLAASGSYTNTPDIMVTSDGGANWTDVSGNLGGTERYVSRVVTHPTEANTIFVVRSGFSSGNKIYRSTDLGSIWTNVSGNLPNVPHNDLFIDPDNPDNYYAANDLGVYLSTDAGANWNREGNGMPFVPAIDFSYQDYGSLRMLRVATHGRSAFEFNLDDLLPVELVSFSAGLVDSKVIINWSTVTEQNNYGFQVEKSEDGKNWTSIGFVKGSGNSNSEKSYSFTDNDLSFAKILYRLKQIDVDGSSTYSKSIEISIDNIANGFTLEQNYPNPFNPVTNIKFGFSKNTKAKLVVYDILGSQVAVLFNEVADAGRIYRLKFGASNLASGVYLYKLETEKGIVAVKKMILLK